MIKGKDNVIAFIRTNDTPYWVVYPKGGKNSCLFRSSEQPNLSMTESLEMLSERLDLLENGQYVISGRTTPDQTKTFREIAFELLNNSPSISNPNHTQTSLSNENIQSMINSAVDKVRHEFETAQLKEKIAQLETENKAIKENNFEAAVSGIIKRLDPYVEPICDRMFGKPQNTQIAAVGFNNDTKTNTTNMNPTQNAPTTQEEATKRVQAALALWQENDPSGKMILVIEKIAHIAASDPGKYNMYVPMLLN